TLLKPGLGDVVLPVLFGHGLREASPALADALAGVYWPGASDQVERAELEADAVAVVYGGHARVAGVRTRSPPTPRLGEYRPRRWPMSAHARPRRRGSWSTITARGSAWWARRRWARRRRPRRSPRTWRGRSRSSTNAGACLPVWSSSKHRVPIPREPTRSRRPSTTTSRPRRSPGCWPRRSA